MKCSYALLFMTLCLGLGNDLKCPTTSDGNDVTCTNKNSDLTIYGIESTDLKADEFICLELEFEVTTTTTTTKPSGVAEPAKNVNAKRETNQAPVKDAVNQVQLLRTRRDLSKMLELPSAADVKIRQCARPLNDKDKDLCDKIKGKKTINGITLEVTECQTSGSFRISSSVTILGALFVFLYSMN